MYFDFVRSVAERLAVSLGSYVYALFGVLILARRLIDDLLRHSVLAQQLAFGLTLLACVVQMARFVYLRRLNKGVSLNEKTMSPGAQTKVSGFTLIGTRGDLLTLGAVNLLALFSLMIFHRSLDKGMFGFTYPGFVGAYLLTLLINCVTFFPSLRLMIDSSLSAIEGSTPNRDRIDLTFWGTVASNWLTNTYPYALGVLTTILNDTLLNALGGYGSGQSTVDVMKTMSASSMGILVALYVFRVSFLAKASDILLDVKGEVRDYADTDSACDVLADGTFAKLIVYFLTFRGLLTGTFDNILFVRNNLVVLAYALWRVNRSRTDEGSQLDSVSRSSRRLTILCMLLDPKVTVGNLLTVVGAHYVLSPGYYSALRKYIGDDNGLIGLLPLLSSYVVNSLSFFTLGNNLVMNQQYGLGAMPAMLHLDQAGYIADLQGEGDERMDLLDVVGNQNKGVFKLYLGKYVHGSMSPVPVETHSANVVSAHLLTAVSAALFYSYLRESSGEEIFAGTDRLNAYQLYFVAAMTVVPGNADPMFVDSFVLAGACADNLKKVQQLKLVEAGEESLRVAKYVDLMGDFMKDVVYPLTVVTPLLLDSLKVYSWVQIELRFWLNSLRLEMVRAVHGQS